MGYPRGGVSRMQILATTRTDSAMYKLFCHNPVTARYSEWIKIIDCQESSLHDGGCKVLKLNDNTWRFLVAEEGLEPPTRGLWFRCSNHLSYSANEGPFRIIRADRQPQCHFAFYFLRERDALSWHKISNIIETPKNAVPPLGSNGGETSTISAPIRLTPFNSRTTCNAW